MKMMSRSETRIHGGGNFGKQKSKPKMKGIESESYAYQWG
jgi:hypothetical protein